MVLSVRQVFGAAGGSGGGCDGGGSGGGGGFIALVCLGLRLYRRLTQRQLLYIKLLMCDCVGVYLGEVCSVRLSAPKHLSLTSPAFIPVPPRPRRPSLSLPILARPHTADTHDFRVNFYTGTQPDRPEGTPASHIIKGAGGLRERGMKQRAVRDMRRV
ncbi:hypothetical protein E2C01_040789 [Portunus trituberculatus]|uniref:Uncharacterized protein n=1 Tax=Portunus trituberculatus TaxID=210409 RepID=A0A5B7FNJ0_PORTR|nr:hypothetical protein [Portunus trituberculatus]